MRHGFSHKIIKQITIFNIFFLEQKKNQCKNLAFNKYVLSDDDSSCYLKVSICRKLPYLLTFFNICIQFVWCNLFTIIASWTIHKLHLEDLARLIKFFNLIYHFDLRGVFWIYSYAHNKPIVCPFMKQNEVFLTGQNLNKNCS